MAVSAYILIQTEVGKAAQVATSVRAIEGVVAADARDLGGHEGGLAHLGLDQDVRADGHGDPLQS